MSTDLLIIITFKIVHISHLTCEYIIICRQYNKKNGNKEGQERQKERKQ